MAKKSHILKNIKVSKDNMTLDINLSRFEKQYNKAQYELDSMVMASMIPYMPHVTGNFIDRTQMMSQAIAGSGKVVAAAPPVGRYLYEGKVMVGERTRSAWAEKGEKKVATEKQLTYSRESAQPHWFEVAKEIHGDKWAEKVKKTAGGGKKK